MSKPKDVHGKANGILREMLASGQFPPEQVTWLIGYVVSLQVRPQG